MSNLQVGIIAATVWFTAMGTAGTLLYRGARRQGKTGRLLMLLGVRDG